ncbi:hypothetical protein EDB19DRAFT_1828278 [Suillus lakei]|nr:hypothetical protein EDB19DRAFT_1828278 [Suillus lakei]
MTVGDIDSEADAQINLCISHNLKPSSHPMHSTLLPGGQSVRIAPQGWLAARNFFFKVVYANAMYKSWGLQTFRNHMEPVWNRELQASEPDFLDLLQVMPRLHSGDGVNGVDVESTTAESIRHEQHVRNGGKHTSSARIVTCPPLSGLGVGGFTPLISMSRTVAGKSRWKYEWSNLFDLFSVIDKHPDASGPVFRSLRAITMMSRCFLVQFGTATVINSNCHWDSQDDDVRLSIQFCCEAMDDDLLLRECIEPEIIFDICQFIAYRRRQTFFSGEFEFIHLHGIEKFIGGLINILRFEGSSDFLSAQPQTTYSGRSGYQRLGSTATTRADVLGWTRLVAEYTNGHNGHSVLGLKTFRDRMEPAWNQELYGGVPLLVVHRSFGSGHTVVYDMHRAVAGRRSNLIFVPATDTVVMSYLRVVLGRRINMSDVKIEAAKKWRDEVLWLKVQEERSQRYEESGTCW